MRVLLVSVVTLVSMSATSVGMSGEESASQASPAEVEIGLSGDRGEPDRGTRPAEAPAHSKRSSPDGLVSKDDTLSREQAEAVRRQMWEARREEIRAACQAAMDARRLTHGELQMPFAYRVFGEAPESGRSLVISMHGGGGTAARVNDRQWENQKRLYSLEEGVYVAPRAPTDTWNLWHQSHIDPLFERLIRNLIVLENVNPDRVYLTGYSAGGDGVYQLAPRMADRFAAAAMMAGHPNETSPLGLRNLPFTLHVGGRDAAYRRNAVAEEWKDQLSELKADDPGGYTHWVEIHADKGHWMDREDAAAIPWMMKFTRRTAPNRVVWKQDDVTHDQFYWLAVPPGTAKPRSLVVARVDGQVVTIEESDVTQLIIRLRDDLLDLDRPVTVRFDGQTLFKGHAPRTSATIARTLEERDDPGLVWTAEIALELEPALP